LPASLAKMEAIMVWAGSGALSRGCVYGPCGMDSQQVCFGCEVKQMNRNKFAGIVYDLLHDDPNYDRSNKIIDAADEYAESMAYNRGLTVSEAYAVAEFIDMNIFSAIRNDDDFDSFQCLRNLCKAYEKLCEISGFVGLTDAERPPKEP